jgi:hypothetical protein
MPWNTYGLLTTITETFSPVSRTMYNETDTAFHFSRQGDMQRSYIKLKLILNNRAAQ